MSRFQAQSAELERQLRLKESLTDLQEEQAARDAALTLGKYSTTIGVDEGVERDGDLGSYEIFIDIIAASEEGAGAVRPLINDTLALSEAFEEAGLSVDELVQHIMALGNPNALNLKEVKQQLAEAFSGEPK